MFYEETVNYWMMTAEMTLATVIGWKVLIILMTASLHSSPRLVDSYKLKINKEDCTLTL